MTNLLILSSMSKEQLVKYAQANGIAKVRAIQFLQAAKKERQKIDEISRMTGRSIQWVVSKEME